MPIQFLDPARNGLRLRCMRGSRSLPSHLSGLNFSGSGNTSGSMCMVYGDKLMGVCSLKSVNKSLARDRK